jgi:hypothetical protein
MQDPDFPSHSFDLLFDIKTRQELVRQYAQLKQELESLDILMASHGIEFTPDELAVISPENESAETHSTPKP